MMKSKIVKDNNMIRGSIGIAFTERNRHDAFKKSYEQMLKFLPTGAKLVVVDDASTNPFPEATFRFENNVGIARAKNKCLELLEDCEHIFLFDSDTYPLCYNWHTPYVKSSYNHLMYIFKDFPSGAQLNDSTVEYQDKDIIAYTHPRGCMLYFHNRCLVKAGGMRKEFGLWGCDHVELSERIFNLGLTRRRFADVVGSNKLIHSMDEHREVITTVGGKDRQKELSESLKVYEKVKGNTDFVPYKEKNIVITCYFTTLVDPQRGSKWPYQPQILDRLANSVPEDVDFIAIMDHYGRANTEGKFYYDDPKNLNPYFAKWISFRDYILAHPEYDNIALVDGTDVEVLNDPFHNIDSSKLYCGDETGTLNNQWLRFHHPEYLPFLNRNINVQILNAGVIVGHRNILLKFLDKMIEGSEVDTSLTDMAKFNYVLRTYFNSNIISGRQVTTVFKANQRTTAWFKHK